MNLDEAILYCKSLRVSQMPEDQVSKDTFQLILPEDIPDKLDSHHQ